MKSDKNIIRKNHMEQLHFITKLLDIKDPNIQIIDIINRDTHKEIIARLDYEAPSCPDCGSLMKKYDFQKPSKLPYLETTGMPTRILLRKRRFNCYQCSKMMVAETSIVKKNHQIPRITNQKIAQKLIEKTSMTDIAHQLAISTSTVIRKLNDFHFKHDFSRLPEIMSWDEYAFTKGKMSFIAQDFDNLNIITVLEGRTQAIIRNHFLRYYRAVRCQVKIITMDMFSPYYDLAKQLLRFRISRLRLKQSTGLFYSNILAVLWVVFVCKSWINLTENLMNIESSSATGNSSNKIVGR